MKSRARLLPATALPFVFAGCSSVTQSKIPDWFAAVVLGVIIFGLAGYIAWKKLSD